MGFSITRRFHEATGEHVVSVRVSLSMAETNALFLAGDTIVSWPEGELRADEGDTLGPREGPDRALTRTGMFVSELARLPKGLEIGYRQASEAERASQLVRLQLLRAGVEEVS